MKALHILITDFNGFAQTRRCLEALRASRFQDFTALVVDHGTSGETRTGLASEFPEVICIEGSPDLWWTGATNLGVRSALQRGADFVMLLNNDCYVTTNTVGALVTLAKANPEAIIAPIQRDCESGGATSISPRTCFLLGFPSLSGPKRLHPALASHELLRVRLIIGGRATIIPSSLFERIGLFDEASLPHYGADHDFYLRARKAGGILYTATRAFVDIDNTRTSVATNPGHLTFQEFQATLRNTRSHRNVRDIATLFRKHYPIRCLSILGLSLYLSRYFIVYLMHRAANRIRCVVHT